MILDYGTQISFEPIKLAVGTIKKPTLREISKISFAKFQLFESILRLEPQDFFENDKIDNSIKEFWNKLTDEEKSKVTTYTILLIDEQIAILFTEAFDFFFEEDVSFEENIFILRKQGEIVGYVDENIFMPVVETIQQICGIYEMKRSDLGKITFKNKGAEKLYERLLKGKKKFKKQQEKEKKNNKDYTLPNIISAVANRHPSLNYTNIFDITVFQLLDAFQRIYNNEVQDISARSVSVWGDEKKKFDGGLWHKNIYDKDEILI